jgi:mannose-6-phosphate isomerase-like protein (cupin superfamily)
MLDEVPGYKIKRMRVHPGGRLSTQTHDDAVEHWIVVSGVAAYHLDGVVRFATSGHTIDVPAGMRHQMVNPGRDELVVLDIQHGTYAATNTTFHDDHG